MTDIAKRAAQIFADLRDSGGAMAQLPPDLRPTTMAEAYAIQDVAGRQHGVYGWKIGSPKPGDTDPRCSMLFGPGLLTTPASMTASELPRGLAELEIGFTFARDVPPDADRDTVLAAIGEAHLAIEVLNSRFSDRTIISDYDGVADHQAALAVVVAPGQTDWSGLTPETLPLTLTINGDEVRSVPGSLALTPTLDMIVWLAGHARSRGFPLRAGTVVITGARVGPIELAGVHRLDGTAEGFAPVSLHIIA